MLFGRSKHQLECITTEFLPFDEQLHIVVADADMNLQILQYDPESMSSSLPSYTDYTDTSRRPQIRRRLTPSPQVDFPHRPLSHYAHAPRKPSENASDVRIRRNK